MALTSAQISFMKSFYNKASEICPVYGLKAIAAITAQAMCESNWNKSLLSSKYYNFFGMKCGASWTGRSVNLQTKEEYKKGSVVTIRDNFRVYDSLEDGIKGYCDFITLYPRYRNLIGLTDNVQFIRTIKADGWATASAYVTTLTNIMNNYVLKMCEPPKTTVELFPKYEGFSISIVVALREIGSVFDYKYRKKIAAANGIQGYSGTVTQNQKMLKLLKEGKLIKP